MELHDSPKLRLSPRPSWKTHNLFFYDSEAYSNADELLVAHNGDIHFDLWQANATQLRALGVEQIESANICTAHHTDDFYSWRAERGVTGRFGAIIAIRKS